ncbi:hypothetical protein WJ438_34495 [Streptomyces sp. GD-15H]|uniref:hypothetical protein n=1 Tax=Streptomyces sp. GD-15H TaxID=3129112 RepID=UPI00325513C6
MSVAQHIAVIDEPFFRPFPAEHGPSGGGFAGPGHHVAVLAVSTGPRSSDPVLWE